MSNIEVTPILDSIAAHIARLEAKWGVDIGYNIEWVERKGRKLKVKKKKK